ncbi:hypothetical protein HZS_1658 [Henneguya salminicola]|nr:hypothetical protein HZS_1658 [Henneguya salminicola]
MLLRIRLIPYIISQCCDELEKNYLETIGLHRVCGVARIVKGVIHSSIIYNLHHFFEGQDCTPRTASIISGILLHVLSSIPNKLITKKMMKKIEKYYKHAEKTSCLNCMNKYLFNLSTITKEILVRVFLHFSKISAFSNINKVFFYIL